MERDPRLFVPHAVAYLNDVLVLALFGLLAMASVRVAPESWRGAVRKTLLAGLFAIGLLLSAYPVLLREFLAFPANLLAADGSSARVLLTEYLGVLRLWPVGVAAVLGALVLGLPVRFPPRWRRPTLAAAVLVGVIALPTLTRTSPHPFVYSLQEQIKSALSSHPRVVPSLRRLQKSDGVAGWKARIPAVSFASSPFRKIFVIVLEGVTAADFEAEFLPRRGGFYERVRGNALYFCNYRATNLDSYTSLIAMLTSLQVPYRAYADDSLYDAVNRADNLTRDLKRNGYWTLFLSTYEHQPFVPTRSEWDRIMDRRDLGPLEGWLSLGNSRMEAATEDRAALAPMVDQAASHDRAFVMHELVYGHSPGWRAASGRTQLEYYDSYLQELQDRLASKGVDRESLMVVVSDHGDRTKSADPENYRVPLLVVGPDVPTGWDKGFRNHLDLQGIVTSCMTGRALPQARTEVFAVGSTERWIYGRLRADGSHLFLDDATGRVLSNQGAMRPLDLSESFQTSLDDFASHFGPRGNRQTRVHSSGLAE